MIADYDEASAQRAAAVDDRFTAARVDASSADVDLRAVPRARDHPRDERRRPALRDADLRRRLRRRGGLPRHGDVAVAAAPGGAVRAVRREARRPAVRAAPDWEGKDRLALVGIGVEPGLSDVFARYAADHLFCEIDEIGVRDGANLAVAATDEPMFAPSFSIWTTIEECLNPPVIWEDGEVVHDAAVQRAGGVRLPRRHRPGRVRQRRARGGPPHAALARLPARVTFKYGLGDEFIDVLKTLHKLGLDRTREGAGGASRSAPATSSRPACRTRPSWARG